MTRHFKSSLLLVTVVVLMTLVSGPVLAKNYKWKMTTSWPSGIPLYTDMAELYAQTVEQLSNGQMKIQVLPGGAIAPALESVIPATEPPAISIGSSITYRSLTTI